MIYDKKKLHTFGYTFWTKYEISLILMLGFMVIDTALSHIFDIRTFGKLKKVCFKVFICTCN